MKYLNIKSITSVLLLIFTFSCTDLDSEIYSELTPETEYTSDATAIAAVLSAYAPLKVSYGNNGLFEVQELSSETSAAPAKFGPWDDGGIWKRLHEHNWENNAWFIDGTWNMCFGGIADCNRLIGDFQSLSEASGVDVTDQVNELRAVRALYLYTAMDLWGDVPVVTTFYNSPTNPNQESRAEVYQFLVDELTELIPVLSEGVGGEWYGRMNKWSAMALLARIYLNAEVYTGTAQWEAAADMAKQIIDAGVYTLQPNYSDNFSAENSGSIENIFVIEHSASRGGAFNMHMRTLHPLNKETYNLTDGPWNGYTALEEFYNSFEEDDDRKEIFIVGQQYTIDGDSIHDPNGAIEEDSEGNKDPDGTPLIFTPEINELWPKAFSQSGARIGKYEIVNGLGLAMDNDFPVFRFAEMLLIRAEALWRMDPSSAEAVELIRQVRERAGLGAIDPLTEDELYKEIQRELAFEAQSRTIMIRFDRFNNPWWEKTVTDPNKNLFPIPTNQLNGNPNLVQNPGY